MADHSELVAEMPTVEKMNTQERLKHAKKRRMQQLKRWSQREKEATSKKKKTEQNLSRMPRKNDYKVHFVPSVMLLEAAARNDIEEVRRLLMLGVSPDSTNEDGLTALHQCCIDDSEEMMKLLIEFGANVNAKDSEQWTPLHAAATCGHLHLVKYLISKGADLLAVNADGNMPYDICEDESTLDYIESEMAKRGITQEMIDDTRAATERQMLSDLKWMLENGHDCDERDHQGATPLHIGAANGYLSVVEYLLDHHASTDACDNDMWQPIHAAACWGHPDVIEYLVQAGADLGARTKNGETPFDICEDPELKERILQLKNEMETKRASQPNKLRRSHSANTRSHSIRRTSIREKSQISRREAREEARLRHEKQEQANGEETNMDDELKQRRDSNEYEKPENSSLDDVEINAAILGAKDSLQRLKGKAIQDALEREEAMLSDDLEYHDRERTSQSKESPEASPEQPRSPEVWDETNAPRSISVEGSADFPESPQGRGQGESVKVEIHVTVNTSPTYSPSTGTLSNLKKHRSDMRSRNSLTLSSSQQDLSGTVVTHNGHHFSATYTYDSPSPPSVRKFRSDPSEIVGEANKHGCCSIM